MRRFAIILGISALIGLPRAAEAREICYPTDKTPYCLNDPFSEYWEQNGGLAVFGYPITAPANEVNGDTGRTYLTQWVERNRLEDHPDESGPYRVLLGLLGKERLAQLGRDWEAEPRESGPKDGCLWFEQTGHNVCNIEGDLGFKTYWETHGLGSPGLDKYARSLQLFGLPLTEPKMETNGSGDTVLTQWFERARFEWHPNNPAEFKVLLGLLGTEVHGAANLPPEPPTPEPAVDPCPEAVPAHKGVILSSTCINNGDKFTITASGYDANEVIVVYLTTPDKQRRIFPAIAGNRYPDATGTYSIQGAFPVGTPPGLYSVTVEDTQNTINVGYFQISRPDPAYVPAVDYGTLPAQVNATPRPFGGEVGTVFTFEVSGFKPGALISIYGTEPDGTIFTAPFHNIADGNGNIRDDMVFLTKDSKQVGYYATTFESTDPPHKAIAYVQVMPWFNHR